MTVGSAELSPHPSGEVRSTSALVSPPVATALAAGATLAIGAALFLLDASPAHVLLAAALAAVWGLRSRFATGPAVEAAPEAPPALDPVPAPSPAPKAPALAPTPVADDRPGTRALAAAAARGFGACDGMMSDAADSVVRGQRLLHESVASLLESFTGLKAETEAQSRLVVELVDRFARGRDGADGLLERFIAETDSAMRDFVEHIVLVSKQSVAMASRVQDINTQMDEIEAVTVRARKLASNTSMLALNAKIEAAQAGQRAAGFTVIADEVQTLARESEDFNLKISHLVGTMRKTVSDTQAAIQDLASQDMNRAVAARGRADSLGGEVEQLNAQMRDSLQSVSTVAERVDRDIAAAVRALQFEDIVRQTLDHTVAALDIGRDLSRSARTSLTERTDDPTLPTQLDAVVAEREASAASIHKTAEQETMEEGDIELF